jgi:hypothetical protein
LLEKFKIIIVPDDAPEANEQMGSKGKFWFTDPDLGPCMFKWGRPGTGEDWAEKFACEIAELLDLPCANYELAEWRGQEGLITKTFIPPNGGFVPGNWILRRSVKGYPSTGPASRVFWRVRQHTLAIVLGINSRYRNLEVPFNWQPPAGITHPKEVFIGYLMLDALIGNTDRHHENWAWVFQLGSEPGAGIRVHLAPTYDHASSLGRELRDEERFERLTTKDRNRSVEAYATKAMSAIFDSPSDKRPLTTFDVFQKAALQFASPAHVWLENLSSISEKNFEEIAERFPENRISISAAKFALEVIRINRKRLLDLKKVLS